MSEYQSDDVDGRSLNGIRQTGFWCRINAGAYWEEPECQCIKSDTSEEPVSVVVDTDIKSNWLRLMIGKEQNQEKNDGESNPRGARGGRSKEVGQQSVEKVISKARKPSMNKRNSKEPSDEVLSSDSKTPKEKEELSDWEEEYDIPLSSTPEKIQGRKKARR